MWIKATGLALITLCMLQTISSQAQDFVKLPAATDSTYGRVPSNPIRLRKGDMGHSMANAMAYLAGLRTLDNQALRQIARWTVNDPTYEKPAMQLKVRATGLPVSGKLGLLDKYTFLTSATQDTVVLYVDIYNRGALALPTGLKYEQGLR